MKTIGAGFALGGGLVGGAINGAIVSLGSSRIPMGEGAMAGLKVGLVIGLLSAGSLMLM